MKFYDCVTAPSPRRARIFIAEKGMTIDKVEVNLRAGEQFTEAFKAINPACTVPVLLLDDGTAITENVGIARYLEEISPEPALLGRDPKEKALIASWNARIEFEGLFAVAEAFRNSAKGMQHRSITGPIDYEQIPALVERGRARVREFLRMLDEHLQDREYIVGDAYSMADITALVTVDFVGWIKIEIPAQYTNLIAWHEAAAARPASQA